MANFSSSSISAILKHIENSVLPDILIKLAREVKSMVKDYIYQNLYSIYSPIEYQRTGEFLESLDVRALSNNTVEIFFNTDYISSNYIEDSRWNQHMSVDGSETWNGKSVPEWMPYFIEFGVSKSLWDRDGIHSMETIQKQLETTKFHLKEIVKMLKAKGITAKID